MYCKFYANFLFPLGSKIKGRNIYTLYKKLKEYEKHNKKQINEYVTKKYKYLLQHSYKNVPYYRKKWKEINFNPFYDFDSLKDLRKIPILTKEQIQQNLNSMIALNIPSNTLIKNFTGGSTGKPLVFYQTKEVKDLGAAEIYRNFNMCGWKFGDKYAFLWGADRDSPKKTLQTFLEQKLRRYIWMNAFTLSEDLLKNFTLKLKKFKPQLLVGYASSLYELALYIEKNGIELNIPSVQSSAEKLYPIQRKLIQNSFNSNVFDRYGCREVGNIAHECSSHTFLHVSEHINYVEVLDQNNESITDDSGRITVTNLHNLGMPFIRYQNEDVGVLKSEKCNCGLETSLLEPTIGRESDNFITSSGKIIHGEFFTHLFYNLPEIRQFQVIQESFNLININVVRNEAFNNINLDKLFAKIEKEIKEWFKEEELEICFKEVKKITPSPTGKYRFTISKVWKKNKMD